MYIIHNYVYIYIYTRLYTCTHILLRTHTHNILKNLHMQCIPQFLSMSKECAGFNGKIEGRCCSARNFRIASNRAGGITKFLWLGCFGGTFRAWENYWCSIFYHIFTIGNWGHPGFNRDFLPLETGGFRIQVSWRFSLQIWWQWWQSASTLRAGLARPFVQSQVTWHSNPKGDEEFNGFNLNSKKYQTNHRIWLETNKLVFGFWKFWENDV